MIRKSHKVDYEIIGHDMQSLPFPRMADRIIVRGSPPATAMKGRYRLIDEVAFF